MGKSFKERFKILWRNHSIEKFAAFGFAFFILYNFREIFTKFIIKHFPDWTNQLILTFQSSLPLNWATFIIVLIGIITIIVRAIKKSECISSFLFCFLVFLLFSSYRDRSVWNYLTLPFTDRYDYGHFFDIFLSVFLIVEIIIFFIPSKIKSIIKKLCKSKNKDNSLYGIGFVQNTDIRAVKDVGRIDYAKNITDRIKSMDEINESFAIGITGPWGAGKTTFMEQIKDSLKTEDFIILEFEPWTCTDYKQISKTFFDSLINKVEPRDSKLAREITKYADLINDIDQSSWIAKVMKILKFTKSYSITEIRDQVKRRITGRDKIIIFIDDLDRLGSDELYEVLKLIRTTANFKNIIYIVAYDSIYVEKLLSEREIKEGASFIKKIINVEIALPGYEGHHIPILFYDDLSTIIEQKQLELIKPVVFLKDKNRDQYIVSKYLSGFRDVKRFANIFALNYSQIFTKKNSNNINLKDFFLIELLHYSYPKAYYVLKSNPKLLLVKDDNKNVYVLKKELLQKANNEEIQKALSELGMQANEIFEDLLFLLQLIFKESYRYDFRSIQKTDNYYEYFYYRNLEDKLSLESFNKVINAKTDCEVEKIVKEWCDNGIPLDYSIRNRFSDYETITLSEQKAKNYLLALLKYTRYTKTGGLNNLMVSILKQNNFKNTIVHNIITYIIDEIKKEIQLNTNPCSWLLILKALYTPTPIDTDNCWINESLLSNHDIEELKKYYFEFWYNKNEISFDFKQIFQSNSFINQYLRASVVMNEYDSFVDGMERYVLLGKEYLFEKLKCEGEDNFKSYEINLTEESNNKPDDYFSDIDEYGEYNWKIVQQLFASKETYMDFISKCVDGVNEEKIIEHLRIVGIDKSDYENHLKNQMI